MKKLTVRIPREMDMQLGIEAIKRETSKQALVIESLEKLFKEFKEAEEMREINYELVTYSDGHNDYPAIHISWADVEDFLGAPHTGDDWEQDERLVDGLIAAGAPAWVQDAPGWVDELGWGLYDPENPLE